MSHSFPATYSYVWVREILLRVGRRSDPPRGGGSLVSFGLDPARVDDNLIELLRAHKALVQAEPERLFRSRERARLTEPPFSGLEGGYQTDDGERRVMVLIEILSRSVAVRVFPACLRKVN